MYSDKIPHLKTGAELRSYLRELFEISRRKMQGPLWIAIGDFDRLKHFNNLYGRMIVDYLHSRSRAVIEMSLADAALSQCTTVKRCLFLGDEVVIVLPPSPHTPDDIHSFLNSINQQVHNLFSRRYLVAALSIEGGSWEYRAAQESEIMSRMLGALNIILDPAPRRKGYLMLIPLVDEGEEPAQALHRTVKAVKAYLDDDDAQAECTFQWLYNPDTQCHQSVNNGYLLPPSISWGAVSSEILNEGAFSSGKAGGTFISDMDRDVETLLETAHHALHQSKVKRNSITVSIKIPLEKRMRVGAEEMVILPEKQYSPKKTRYPIISDEFLNDLLSELSIKERSGTLIQFGKSYLVGVNSSSREGVHKSGLKTINDHYGYGIGDRVICLLESVFHQELNRFCRARRIRRADVFISRFIDVFTLYFFNRHITLESIRSYAARVLKRFNAHAPSISLASLTASVVYNREKLRGFELARRLAVTSLSGLTAEKDEIESCITVKEYSPACEEKAGEIIEHNALRSARIITSKDTRAGI